MPWRSMFERGRSEGHRPCPPKALGQVLGQRQIEVVPQTCKVVWQHGQFTTEDEREK